MKTLQLSSQLPDKVAAALKGQRLTGRHYKVFLNDTLAVRRMDGALLAVLIKEAIPQDVLIEVLPHLLTLQGNLENRSTVVGAGSQMQGIRKDGTLSPRRRVPKAVLAAHGGKGDQLGYFDYDHQADCRQTRWTAKRPEALIGCSRLIARVNDVYRQVTPFHYARQIAKVDEISSSLKIAGTPFTTITVNKNNRTAAHYDKGDMRDGLGCMTTHGDFLGGYFIMPKFEIAFDVEPGDVLLADVHQLHGNAAMSGLRVSCVYYAREKMHLCGTKE